jgi:Ca2+-binding EF-hand superfamily protein
VRLAAPASTLASLHSCIPASLHRDSTAGPKTNTAVSNRYGLQASTNYKEAFSLFDTRGVGRVVLDKLGDLLRACGQNPTLAEIDDLEKSVGGECELRLEP